MSADATDRGPMNQPPPSNRQPSDYGGGDADRAPGGEGGGRRRRRRKRRGGGGYDRPPQQGAAPPRGPHDGEQVPYVDGRWSGAPGDGGGQPRNGANRYEGGGANGGAPRQGGHGHGQGQGHQGGGGRNRRGKARNNHRQGGGGGGGGKKPNRLKQLFDQLQRGTSIDPHERWHLEREDGEITTRALDLVAPIGRGQRVLIVAPPKAGKTMMLMEICKSITTNHPEASLIALLIDERPEEVTHFKRSTEAEVFASSSDQTAKQHIQITEQALEIAIERVLAGKDVVLLLDSITRLARAQNNLHRGSGRTISGGLGAETMEFPRRIFGSARKIEGGGSLTIIGTALVDTGSKMDNIIFEEFKGTGNTEIMLSRTLFEKRIFPTIDIPKSGTRKEEKLYDPQHLPAIHKMRRVLSAEMPLEAMEGLLHLLYKYPTNEEALEVLNNTVVGKS